MPKYVERMIQEQKDLEGKIKKGKEAVNSNPFGMTVEEKNYLETQIGYMEQYLDVLKKRIDIAKNK